jgi:hypothetical protein
MAQINCSVNNCSHNKSGVCYSNRVNIGGLNSSCAEDTCCGSFLDKQLYSDLTNNTNASGPCDALVCKVENCSYNCNNLCNLSNINVGGNNVKVYSEAHCESFEEK